MDDDAAVLKMVETLAKAGVSAGTRAREAAMRAIRELVSDPPSTAFERQLSD